MGSDFPCNMVYYNKSVQKVVFGMILSAPETCNLGNLFGVLSKSGVINMFVLVFANIEWAFLFT